MHEFLLSQVSSHRLLTLRPSGGSLVSLMEFCNIDMGKGLSNKGGGSAERKSLQSWFY